MSEADDHRVAHAAGATDRLRTMHAWISRIHRGLALVLALLFAVYSGALASLVTASPQPEAAIPVSVTVVYLGMAAFLEWLAWASRPAEANAGAAAVLHQIHRDFRAFEGVLEAALPLRSLATISDGAAACSVAGVSFLLDPRRDRADIVHDLEALLSHVEVVVEAALGRSRDEIVTNLMVVLTSEELQRVNVRWVYDDVVEGRRDGDGGDAAVLIAWGGPCSDKSPFALRIPSGDGPSLPGAPRAIQELMKKLAQGRGDTELALARLEWHDVPRTSEIAPTELPNDRARKSMEAHFARLRDEGQVPVESFLSIAIPWVTEAGAGVIAVLNINCRAPHVFSEPRRQRILIAALKPTLPFLAALAAGYKLSLTEGDPDAGQPPSPDA